MGRGIFLYNPRNLLKSSPQVTQTASPLVRVLSQYFTMHLALSLASLALVAATPTKVEKRQISLPPLIPSIPGVTEPLNSLIPPLPILQFPTPALDSPPFEVKDIKPKKIGYFWTGAGDNKHKDFLITTSLDDVRTLMFCIWYETDVLGHFR